jgi:Fe-S-cluster containining protein
VNACPGKCCAVFWLPWNPTALREHVPTLEDGAFIADMVIPLGPDEAKARAERFGMSWPALNITDENADQVYTCRHWDETTRLCTVYEQRPRVCRDYPYDLECGHCGYRESEETQAKWRTIRSAGDVPASWDWRRWRWSTKRGGYRPRDAAPHSEWKPGEGWTWDGTVLRPTWDGGAWDHRRRRWRVKA